MLDAQLVAAAVDSREAWEKVHPHLSADDFTPAGAFWWKLVEEWYGRDRASKSIDRSSLAELGGTRIPNPKHRDTLLGFARDLPVGGSAPNAALVALELKRHNVGLELAAAIAGNDDKKLSKLVPVYAELRAATELKGKAQVRYEEAARIEELFQKVGAENRIPLYPSRLNERISGGALPGHHVVLFGRPEIGKSTVSINLACGLAIRGKQRVLYVGNEDQINIIKARAVGRVSGFSAEELEKRREEAVRAYIDSGGEERLRFIQMFDGGADDLRQPIEEFGPTVLVLDQIRNLAAGADVSSVERYERNGQAVRRLLLEYKLVGCSITQAGATAAGKAWLTMEDMDGTKTGLPSTADLIIGIGASGELEARNQRALSFPKNKLSSAQNAHEGLIVDVDKARCAVK